MKTWVVIIIFHSDYNEIGEKCYCYLIRLCRRKQQQQTNNIYTHIQATHPHPTHPPHNHTFTHTLTHSHTYIYEEAKYFNGKVPNYWSAGHVHRDISGTTCK